MMKKNLYVTPEMTLTFVESVDVLTLSARELCDYEKADRVIYGPKRSN